MADASQGAQAKLCMEPGASPHTFDTSSEPYEFVSESLKATKSIIDTNGIRGTRSHHGSRTREDVYTVAGDIVLHPSPADLDLLLPRILGASESSDTFALAETLPVFGVQIDRVAKVFSYADCVVGKATFRGKAGPGSFVELVLSIVGKSRSIGAAGSFPELTLGVAANNAPYVFSDGVLTLLSSARKMMDFELVIDNLPDVRFSNSLTATSITPKDRIITLATTNPFTSDETDLLDQAVAGAAGSLVFTNGNMSTTFTFGLLQVPSDDPTIPGKSEITQKLTMTARMTSTTRELVVTHDSAA